MNTKALACFTSILVPLFICLPAAAAQQMTIERHHGDKACLDLIQPILDRARSTSSELTVKGLQKQVADLTQSLGREPEIQATLECLMRYNPPDHGSKGNTKTGG